MTVTLDETHDPRNRSWVPGADDHPVFPPQNLPFGIFSPPDGGPRSGIAIGRHILDLGAVLAAGLLTGEAETAACAARGETLNAMLALGTGPRRALRRRIFALLSADTDNDSVQEARTRIRAALHPANDCRMHLPARIGDYTDFFAGIHHAHNGGVRNQRNPPLSPNYKYVPVAYHGRASSVAASYSPVWRPRGQYKRPEDTAPVFGPSNKLDFELELGIWIGPGNARGEPIPIHNAGRHVAGLCLLNDWTARDIQAWEMAPLGPFLSKNFTTTISPWIVTPEALAPYAIAQAPRPEGDPRPLDYLWDETDQACGAHDIGVEVLISSRAMRARNLEPLRISSSNLRHLYWTIAQLVTHHSSGGCNLQPGDLFGSGTISAPEAEGWGSLAELSNDGKTPLMLPTGETRGFLEDGDEIILRATASRAGYATIGFGDCIGRIESAPSSSNPGDK